MSTLAILRDLFNSMSLGLKAYFVVFCLTPVVAYLSADLFKILISIHWLFIFESISRVLTEIRIYRHRRIEFDTARQREEEQNRLEREWEEEAERDAMAAAA